MARTMPHHPPAEHADAAYDAFSHALGRHHASDAHYVARRDAFHSSHRVIEVCLYPWINHRTLHL